LCQETHRMTRRRVVSMSNDGLPMHYVCSQRGSFRSLYNAGYLTKLDAALVLVPQSQCDKIHPGHRWKKYGYVE